MPPECPVRCTVAACNVRLALPAPPISRADQPRKARSGPSAGCIAAAPRTTKHLDASPHTLLACDLDGTLLDASSQLGDDVVTFLREVERRGVAVVLATGRRRASAWPFQRKLGTRWPCVVQNGALVVCAQTEEVLLRRTLEREVVDLVVSSLEDRELDPLVYTALEPPGPHELYVPDSVFDPTGFLARYLPYVGEHCTRVPRATPRPARRVTRITAHHERPELEAAAGAVHDRLGDRVRSFIGFDQGNRVHRLEFLHPLADKGEAVAWIAEQRGISPERIIAAGDDSNDVEMLHRAARSYAAPGANADAREAADVVVEGDGVPALLAALARCPLLSAPP